MASFQKKVGFRNLKDFFHNHYSNSNMKSRGLVSVQGSQHLLPEKVLKVNCISVNDKYFYSYFIEPVLFQTVFNRLHTLFIVSYPIILFSFRWRGYKTTPCFALTLLNMYSVIQDRQSAQTTETTVCFQKNKKIQRLPIFRNTLQQRKKIITLFSQTEKMVCFKENNLNLHLIPGSRLFSHLCLRNENEYFHWGILGMTEAQKMSCTSVEKSDA